MSSKRCLIRLLLLLSLYGLEAAATPLNDYKHALVDYYGGHGFHPLLLPQGHRVGDVIDIETLAVVRKQRTCFPGLRIDPPTDTVTLPAVARLDRQEASIWVMLRSALGFDAQPDDRSAVFVRLEDVTVQSVAHEDLRAALDDACIDLLPILNDDRMPLVMNRRVNIVAGILRGRASILFSDSSNIETEVQLDAPADWLGDSVSVLQELEPELALEFERSTRNLVLVESQEPQTLAYQPATIFRPRLGGGSAEGTDSTVIDVEPFDAENPVHRERLVLSARLWADSAVGAR